MNCLVKLVILARLVFKIHLLVGLGRIRANTPSDKKKGKKPGKSFALGKVSSKILTAFTRQLSILQDAGLPILRSLRVLEGQCKGGQLKNALIDVCDEIESGSTLSEAMSKSPKAFNRLYVNMIKAGEAGGALEVAAGRRREGLDRSPVRGVAHVRFEPPSQRNAEDIRLDPVVALGAALEVCVVPDL
ncbi:type II secretion system F family protein, partial [Patescibacteria group bacterium]|nr:type II secretion system F family protein [Patescibacteria group bacterium]